MRKGAATIANTTRPKTEATSPPLAIVAKISRSSEIDTPRTGPFHAGASAPELCSSAPTPTVTRHVPTSAVTTQWRVNIPRHRSTVSRV